MLTSTEENYLKSIYKIYERKNDAVSTNAIADKLHTSAASVTDMLKKLAIKNMVEYKRYHGSKLTDQGYKIATTLIRKHRLWESFLVYKLNFSWEEVHDIAEELEHIQSVKLIDRLDSYLGFPKFDPHGEPIPNADGKFTLRSQIPLRNLHEGESGTMVGINNHDNELLIFLNKLKISIGSKIHVLERHSYDHSVSIIVNERKTHMITEKVSRNLLLRKN